MLFKGELQFQSRVAITFTALFISVLISINHVQAQPDRFEKRVRQPHYTVANKTTYFTVPIHTDGMVDFASAINRRLRQGVNAKNNACLPLYEAIGPATTQVDLHDYLWGSNQVEAFFQEIGAPDRVYKMRSKLDQLRPT